MEMTRRICLEQEEARELPPEADGVTLLVESLRRMVPMAEKVLH